MSCARRRRRTRSVVGGSAGHITSPRGAGPGAGLRDRPLTARSANRPSMPGAERCIRAPAEGSPGAGRELRAQPGVRLLRLSAGGVSARAWRPLWCQTDLLEAGCYRTRQAASGLRRREAGDSTERVPCSPACCRWEWPELREGSPAPVAGFRLMSEELADCQRATPSGPTVMLDCSAA
jgi:hypothetical protein